MGQTLDTSRSLRVVRLRPAAAGFETRRLLKWMVGTTIAQTIMVLGGMVGLFWKVFAA